MEFSLPENYTCVITDDGSHISLKLAKSLSARGWRVVIFRFPESVVKYTQSLPAEINRVVLADMSEEHLQQQLNAIANKYGSIGTFIHLNPLTQPNPDNILSDISEKAILKHVFLMAKHLKKSLNEAALHGRSCFLTVTRLDGEFGLGQSDHIINSGVISGGLFGLTKTLNLEWEPVFCRAVDLHPELDEDKATKNIIAELYDPNRLIAEVGYSLQGRTTLVGDSTISKYSSTNTQINSDSVFLVSGGAKGITAQCVIKLAQQAKSKFILIGRSQFIDEPIWAKNCVDEAELKKRIIADIATTGEKPTPAKVQKLLKAILSQREITENLQKITQAGGKAEYISADVTDSLVLKEKLTSVVKKFGAITGIIHGAGNLADKLIEKKSEQDFEAVYAAKIKGLESLLDCVNPNQLQHLILFSSAAGFYGNIGQSDYALANEILNKFAHFFQHRYPKCHVAAFNWGPWDGGMVTPELKQIFAQRNIEVIPTEVGTQIFVDELIAGKHDTVQVLVGGSLATLTANLDSELKTYRIRRSLTLEANPFLNDHVIGGNPVLPATCAVAWIANISEQLYPGYKFFSCENYKVLKGIVFDETLASKYIIDLQEINKLQSNEIELSATIWSETITGKHRYHYTVQIKLLVEIPSAPIYQNFDITQDRSIINTSPYQDGTLFHGSSFQGVKRILNITQENVTMECILPTLDEKQQGQFLTQAFNPYIADMQFQCMLIWARHFYQAASLPLKCDRGESFQIMDFGKTYYVSMDVNFCNGTKLIANITTHDSQGKVYLRIMGAEVTISKQLNSLFCSTKNLKHK
jgi:polyketide-type polyunsaturated fatty acid synthase PfaA